MKIDYFKINGFGKLKNKEINLDKNINIIHGKNEAGKSTILKFINSMFYGAAKTKNGKDISDFDKYKPWKTDEFSGKIKYTLDNNESYEVYREFKKKVPVIYNDKLQDITNEFSIDKTKGIDFIYEQIGIDQDTFENTVITPQDEIKIGKTGQNVIIQKISNLVSSGDENISFKKTLDKINKNQNEQIGTERTNQKPINIVNDKINKLQNEKESLEQYKSLLKNNVSDFDIIEKSKSEEEIKLQILKICKENLESNKIKVAEMEVNKQTADSYVEKIEEFDDKIDEQAKESILKQKKNFSLNYILIIFFMIISIITFILKINIIVPIIALIGMIFSIIILFININKFKSEKNKKLQEIYDLEKRIKQEIEILEKNKNEQENIIKQKEKELKLQNEIFGEKLIQEFSDKINKDFIESVLEMDIEEVFVSISNKEERINSLKFESHTLDIEKNQMRNKIDDLAKIQEELENALQEKNELISLNNSYNIAKECLEFAYEEIRDSLSPVFTEELSKLVSKISDGKYEKIKFNDEEGLTIEIDDGRYVPVERLSIGTMDQMYLSLRLSSINSISNENIPVFLDESFVYFDDERLKNILKFMNEYYPEKQIIIFTCSNREKEALNKLKIQYNLIELENE